MNLTDARTEAEHTTPGVASYRVSDEMDGTGRMTLRAPDGTERTVVDCLDDVVAKRLADRARGATVRAELTPTSHGEGYVAARVLPGGLPSL